MTCLGVPMHWRTYSDGRNGVESVEVEPLVEFCNITRICET